MLLVASGVKPATDITLYGDFKEVKAGHKFKGFNEDYSKILQNEIEKIGKILKELGLIYKVSKLMIQEADEEEDIITEEYVEVVIGRDQNSLDWAFEAFVLKDHEKMGQA